MAHGPSPEENRFHGTPKQAHNQDRGLKMKPIVLCLAVVVSSGSLQAQERKPVPKDSMRVFVPGCSKGYVFTAGRRTEDQPGVTAVPEGTHLRMNGAKALMTEIKGHEGSRIEITGLIKKGQVAQDGVPLGGGVRIRGGASPGTAGAGLFRDPGVSQILIDVEGWRSIPGDCPSH